LWLPPAGSRHLESCKGEAMRRVVDLAGVRRVLGEKARGARDTVWGGEHG
jgi:hypothetical protein